MKINRKSYYYKEDSAFSLIELLVSIAIISSIVGLALPNFLGARSRARDARRKGEMKELKTALQLYNTDYGSYPGDSGGPVYSQIVGCGADGDAVCPCSSSLDFAAGGAGCDTVYMTDFPSEFGTSLFYYSNGSDFCMKTTLEIQSDQDIDTSFDRCSSRCAAVGGSLSSTDYAVCSE